MKFSPLKYALLATTALIALDVTVEAQNVKVVPTCGVQTLTASGPLLQYFFMDETGLLCTPSGGGGGGGGTSSNFGAAFPTPGTAAGFKQGSTMAAGTLTGAGGIEVDIGNTGTVVLGASTANIGTVAVTGGGLAGTVTLAAGSAIAGKFGIDQTTPGTTNLVSIGNGGSVTVLGTVAANIGNNGSITVLGTVPVSGTVGITAASLPLPTGAATSANQASEITQLQSINASVQATGTVVGGTAQAAATSGVGGILNLGAVTTSAPTDATGSLYPLSMTTAGALRVDGSAVTQPISGTTTLAASTASVGSVIDSLHFGFVAATSTELAAVATTTTTAAVTLLPAAVGLHSYLTSAICTRSDAGTVAVAITLAGSISPIIYVPDNGGGGGFTAQFNPPLISSGTNTAITMTVGSATSTVSCTGLGYSGTELLDLDIPEQIRPFDLFDLNAGAVVA